MKGINLISILLSIFFNIRRIGTIVKAISFDARAIENNINEINILSFRKYIRVRNIKVGPMMYEVVESHEREIK